MIFKKLKAIAFLVLAYIKPVNAGGDGLEVDWPTSPVGTPLTAESTVDTLVLYLFEWAMVLGVVFLFGSLIYASFQYITSTGDPNKLSGAKRRVGAAFGGFGLLVLSWMFLNILNPEFALISEVGVTQSQLEEDRADIERSFPGVQSEDNYCDYVLVDYLDQGTILSEEEDRITLLYNQDFKSQKITPQSSIACKNKGEIEKDVHNGAVKFIEAEVVSRWSTVGFSPSCDDIDCLEGGFENYDYCLAEFEEGSPIEEDSIQYCYHQRSVPGGGMTGGGTEVVLFVSQKERNSITTTCLAGDKKLDDGGGCTLILAKDDLANRCTEMITPLNATTGNIRVSAYDHQISCIEVKKEKESF